MSTMRDVAHHAGVSIATVSHVINGTRPVSDELRERVLQSMDALKYQRNTLARALRSRQSGIIGVIVPDNSNPFFAEVAQGIEDVSLEQEYSLIVCNSGNDLGRLLVHTRNLSARQADGIIFATSGDDFVVVREELRDDIPIVVIDLTTLDIPTDAVLFDNFRGGWLAARHLLDRPQSLLGIQFQRMPHQLRFRPAMTARQTARPGHLPNHDERPLVEIKAHHTCAA